jgi:hypothetical protein
MVKEVNVIFKPIEYNLYNDNIMIKILESGTNVCFYIPVRALISTISISIPTGIDMGYCTTNQKSSAHFSMVNIGDIDTSFQWSTAGPFNLYPASGEFVCMYSYMCVQFYVSLCICCHMNMCIYV